MVLVDAGTFEMGGKEEEVEGRPGSNLLTYIAERPVHKVQVSTFYIDKLEVTNAQYARFLEASEGSEASWAHPDQPADMGHEQMYVEEEMLGELQPAVGINWFDAYAYCRWAGKRLPTEAEWEYAARGGKGYRKYPWGDDAPDADDIWWANYRPEAGHARDGYRYTAPVGSYPDGVTPFGLLDMAGNAEEWVQDWYDVNTYRRNLVVADPPGPAQGNKKVAKGGSYGSPEYQIRIAMRFYGRPADKGPRVGIRCAMDP